MIMPAASGHQIPEGSCILALRWYVAVSPKAPSGRMLSRKPAYCWQAGPDTSIFSPHAVAGLCVTIGRYWYLFKRLTAVSAGRFYRFEHIVSYSSFKAHSKQGGDHWRTVARLG